MVVAGVGCGLLLSLIGWLLWRRFISSAEKATTRERIPHDRSAKKARASLSDRDVPDCKGHGAQEKRIDLERELGPNC